MSLAVSPSSRGLVVSLAPALLARPTAADAGNHAHPWSFLSFLVCTSLASGDTRGDDVSISSGRLPQLSPKLLVPFPESATLNKSTRPVVLAREQHEREPRSLALSTTLTFRTSTDYRHIPNPIRLGHCDGRSGASSNSQKRTPKSFSYHGPATPRSNTSCQASLPAQLLP